MLIYLDATIVERCAADSDYVFGKARRVHTCSLRWRKELTAIRQLAEREHLGDCQLVAPLHLPAQLRAAKPALARRATYGALENAWGDSRWAGPGSPSEARIAAIAQSLAGLRLRQAADTRHLAEALARGASWFLTEDRAVIRKTRGEVDGMRVARPTQCLKEILVALLFFSTPSCRATASGAAVPVPKRNERDVCPKSAAATGVAKFPFALFLRKGRRRRTCAPT